MEHFSGSFGQGIGVLLVQKTAHWDYAFWGELIRGLLEIPLVSAKNFSACCFYEAVATFGGLTVEYLL